MSDGASFLYFAYGSNMSHRRIRAANRAPSAIPLGPAWLHGHRLSFDKPGMDGSAKADCGPSEHAGDVVYGGLFRVAAHELDALDRAEGALGPEAGYRRVQLSVETATGPVQAISYQACRKQAGLRAHDWYLQHVLQGAREFGLPEDYVAAIAQVPTAPDTDAARAAREQALHADPGDDPAIRACRPGAGARPGAPVA